MFQFLEKFLNPINTKSTYLISKHVSNSGYTIKSYMHKINIQDPMEMKHL